MVVDTHGHGEQRSFFPLRLCVDLAFGSDIMHANASVGSSIPTQHIRAYQFRIITEDLLLMIMKIYVTN